LQICGSCALVCRFFEGGELLRKMAEKASASLGESNEIVGDVGGSALPDSMDKTGQHTEEDQGPVVEGEKTNLDDKHVTQRVRPQSREGEMPRMKFVNPFADDGLLDTGNQETSEVEYTPEEQADIDKLYNLQTEADDINAMYVHQVSTFFSLLHEKRHQTWAAALSEPK